MHAEQQKQLKWQQQQQQNEQARLDLEKQKLKISKDKELASKVNATAAFGSGKPVQRTRVGSDSGAPAHVCIDSSEVDEHDTLHNKLNYVEKLMTNFEGDENKELKQR